MSGRHVHIGSLAWHILALSLFATGEGPFAINEPAPAFMMSNRRLICVCDLAVIGQQPSSFDYSSVFASTKTDGLQFNGNTNSLLSNFVHCASSF